MIEKKVVLIVEDEEINRILLKRILSRMYYVVEADNGKQAWEFLSENRECVDAIISDIIMPEMDGFALLEKLRQESMLQLPVIVTTGQPDIETEEKVLNAGAWDFVSKPYNEKVLLSRLRNAIARRQVSVYEQMQKLAAHDPLTKLYNRAKMFEETRAMIEDNPDTEFAFVKFDIDHFALYNTSFGEAEGDKLLIFFSNCITYFASTYELSTFGRINADIFCVCFSYDGDFETLKEDVEKLQRHLRNYRRDYLIELSAGVHIIDNPRLSVDDYYFRATIATQKCKNKFEMRLALYDDDSIKKIADEKEIANEMQSALESGEFVVYLQPKVILSTEKVCGSEALVRWNHPRKGLMYPGKFIPVFEKNGFIAKLDYYVWEQTCLMLHRWSLSGRKPNPVSVNISRISLYNPRLVDVMKSLVLRYNISPELLELEITESAYMSCPEQMADTIHGLREAGFKILMDDFGSEYSSLNTLKDIEVDVLKIDMKFLPAGNDVKKGEIILASVIEMARKLGLSVVVEGVETEMQKDFVTGTGCNCVQGFYYSRPIPQKEYEEKYDLYE